MNVYEFVLGLVIVTTIASIIKSGIKYGSRRPVPVAADPEADRLREEVRTLKQRMAVLERIATDKSVMLEREIEELRDR